jgi:hypothetical protein
MYEHVRWWLVEKDNRHMKVLVSNLGSTLYLKLLSIIPIYLSTVIRPDNCSQTRPDERLGSWTPSDVGVAR